MTTFQPSDNRKLDFNFSKLLTRSDHTIIGINSITSNPVGLTFVDQTFLGKKVQASVLNGVDEIVYKISVKVKTNHDFSFEGDFILYVIDILK